jgi:hypothetical protein
VATEANYEAGKDFLIGNFVEIKPFDVPYHDNRSLKEHAIEFHKFYRGSFWLYFR